MSEKQNDVQFKQKDIKYGHKVKRNEELCINHLVMNSWFSDLCLNTIVNVKIILMSQIQYIQPTMVTTRDHTEWALKGKQPECEANMQFHMVLMLRIWA